VAFQRFQNFQANDGFGAYVAMSIPFAFWSKPKYDAGVQEAEAAVSAAQAQQHTLENLTRFQVNDLLPSSRRLTVVPCTTPFCHRLSRAWTLRVSDTMRAKQDF
jgi:hypothetical protein